MDQTLTQTGFAPETLPQPVSGGSEAFKQGELEQHIVPDYWDKVMSMANGTLQNSPTAAIMRSVEMDQLEKNAELSGQPHLSPEDANSKYPGNNFTKPVAPAVAQYIDVQNRKRERDAEWISRGPETGFGTTLIAGSASILDPINMVLNLAVPELGAMAGLGKGIATTFAENTVAMGLAEIPTQMQLSREGQKFNLAETATNVLAGAAVGTGIHAAISYMGSRFKSEINPTETSAGASGTLKSAILDHENDLAVNTSVSSGEKVIRQAGAVEPGTIDSAYVYKPLEHPSESTMYAASHPDTGKLMPIGENIGESGVHMTDNPDVANNMAGNPNGASTGEISSFTLPEDGKYLDLSTQLDSPEGKAFLDSVNSFARDFTDLSQAQTVKEVIESVRDAVDAHVLSPSVIEQVSQSAKDLGYQGFKYAVEHEGQPVHNGVYLFDGQSVTPHNIEKAVKESVPMASENERSVSYDQSNTRENRMGYQAENASRSDKMASQLPVRDDERLKIAAQGEANVNVLLDSKIEELRPVAPKLAEMIESDREAIGKEVGLVRKTVQLAKKLTDCFISGSV